MAEKSAIKLATYGSDQLVKDAGSVSFNTPLGNPDEVDQLDVQGNTWADGVVNGKTKRVPGICRVDYELTPGISKDGASSLNMVTKKLYTFVRHVNSGSRNYDSPDLMNYALSYTSLALFIEQCKRAYRCVMKYSCKNRYLGKALVQALGFDFEDISTNLADFRMLVNIAIQKLNALKVPDTWPIWGKNYVLNTVILKDGDIDKSQLYFFRSTVIWEYNETGEYVGSLTPRYVFGNTESDTLTYVNVKSILDDILTRFVASEDINIMSGDILKAYGEEHCFGLDLLSEDSMIEPIYNREMLEIMHNTTIFEISKVFNPTAGNIIWQDTTNNTLRFDPFIVVSQVYLEAEDNKGGTGTAQVNDKEYIDLFRDDVSPIDVVNASIMTVVPGPVTVDPTEGAICHFEDIGTELPINGAIFYIDENQPSLISAITQLRRHVINVTFDGNSLMGYGNTIAKVATALTKFDWHPRVSYYILNSYGNVSVWGAMQSYAFYDLYNYTVIGKSELKKLHDLHVLGGFGLAE